MHAAHAGSGYDVAFIVADGLSARAVATHARPLLAQVLPRLAGWRIAPLVVARLGRVALGAQHAGPVPPPQRLDAHAEEHARGLHADPRGGARARRLSGSRAHGSARRRGRKEVGGAGLAWESPRKGMEER